MLLASSPLGHRSKTIFLLTLSFAVGLILSSCASNPTNDTKAGAGSSTEAGSFTGTPKEISSFRISDPEPPAVADKELDNIPPEMQSKVELWIAYFQGKGRPHMERYLARSTRYLQLMKYIMKQNGLPEDLVYIALIESGFSPRATSRAAAVGYWQFIKGTGRRYGLEINSFVDERRDPVLSTQAAAEYFKGLYSVFGSWYLSMASYNVGENRVKREVIQTYSRDFWELARKRKLPKETANYVPKFIAARLIGRNPEKYGFSEIDYDKPQEFELIRVNRAVNLRKMAEKMGIDYEDFKLLNPKFRGEVAPTKPNVGLELRVPVGQTKVALGAAQESGVDKLQFIADAGETETYRVRSGDSLFTIAKKYHTTVSWLKDVNEMKAGRKLKVGMRIQVPDRSAGHARAKAKADMLAANAIKSQTPTNAQAMPLTSPVTGLSQPISSSTPVPVAAATPISEQKVVAATPSAAPTNVPASAPATVATTQTPDPAAVAAASPTPAPAPGSEGAVASATEPKASATQPATGSVTVAEAKPDADAEAANNPEIETDKGVLYVVQPGDTLSSIAEDYDSSVRELKKMNKLGRGSMIRVGMKLHVPKDEGLPTDLEGGAGVSAGESVAHVVKSGESLAVIAKQYGVSIKEIQVANNLKKKSKIIQGMTLMIPVKPKPNTSVNFHKNQLKGRQLKGNRALVFELRKPMKKTYHAKIKVRGFRKKARSRMVAAKAQG
jgi:membrane-bound lytic murein transglycosylase D